MDLDANRNPSVDRLHAAHHSYQIRADRQVPPRQLLQRPHSILSVIDRPDQVRAQQLGQLPRIDAVALAAFFEQGIPARITYHQFRDVRLDQVIQPGGPRTFFQCHVQASAQAFEKIQNGAGLGFDRALHHQLARGI